MNFQVVFLQICFSTNLPYIFSHKFNTSERNRANYPETRGYIFSRWAVHAFAEKLLKNASFCSTDAVDEINDWNMSACFNKVKIHAGDARDLTKRECFLNGIDEENPSLNSSDSIFWHWQHINNTSERLHGCSKYSVALNSIPPEYMHTLYYLIYLHKAYGIKNHFPFRDNEKKSVMKGAAAIALQSLEKNHKQNFSAS